jgi:hypothetical protein
VLRNLIYAAESHSLTGPPEAGKTLVLLDLLLAAMRFEYPVMLYDHESGPRHIGQLLNALGADPAMVSKFLTYVPYPQTKWREPDVIDMQARVAQVEPKIVAFDSLGEMLARNGADENKPADVMNFCERVFVPLTQPPFGCGVIVTDHDAKGGEDRFSRYGRGTGAKLGKFEVALKLEPVEPFSRDMDGRIKLTVTKDRPGCLFRWWDIAVTRQPVLALTYGKGRPPLKRGEEGVSPAKLALLAVITDKPATIKRVGDRYGKANGHFLRRNTISTHLNELAALGYVERIGAESGTEALWVRRDPSASLADAGEDPGGWGQGTVGAEMNR